MAKVLRTPSNFKKKLPINHVQVFKNGKLMTLERKLKMKKINLKWRPKMNLRPEGQVQII